MTTVLTPATPAVNTVVNIALTQDEADALLIKTELSHLTEDHYCDEESGSHFYDLEDGRTVEITIAREVYVLDFTKDDGQSAEKLNV